MNCSRRTYRFSAIVCAALLLYGCTDRNYLSPAPDSQAVIEMSIRLQAPAERTRAGKHNDQRIISLYVLLFRSDGTLQTREHVPYSESVLRMTGRTGQNRIIVVGNPDSRLIGQLDALRNTDELNELRISSSGIGIPDTGLLMYGDTKADLLPNRVNTVQVPLSFVGSKITFRITDNLPNGEHLTINGCTAMDLPSGSFLVDRPIDDATAGTAGGIPMNPVQVGFEYIADKQHKGEFYLFESRHGNRSPVPGETPAQAVFNKRLHAPKGASYLIINATHYRPGGSGTFDIYLYFGQDNAVDYNVNRSEHHTYNISVNGFNQVEIDSNIEYADDSFTVTYGDNLRMDAHPDCRPMHIETTSGMLTIDVQDADGNSFESTAFKAGWLRISPLDLMKHQVRQDDPATALWQQPGNAGTFVRGRYIPHQSWRKLLAPVWNDLPEASESDDKMLFEFATHRMCYRLDGLEFTPKHNAQDFFIYADANDTGQERQARVTITRYPTSGSGAGAREVRTFHISQDAPIYIGTSSDGHKLYVESYEESTFNLYPSTPEQLRANSRMQWGYNNQELYNGADKYTNGMFLTANSVYLLQQQSDGSATWRNAPYRNKYSSGQNGRDQVPEPYTGALSSPTYAYPDYNSWHTLYSPIYGSSAARYCHEKNRDTNGDGIIDESEAVWYLPSIQELQQIWLAQNSIAPSKRLAAGTIWSNDVYLSATENNATTIWGYAFGVGITENTLARNKPLRVRCIRRGGKEASSSNQVVESNNRVIIDNSSLPEHSIAAGRKSAAPTSEKSNLTVAHRLQIASRDLNGVMPWHQAMGYPAMYSYTMANETPPTEATGCRGYSEAMDGSDKGTWRMPTSRELLRMSMLKAELDKMHQQKGFTPLKDDAYWSATEDEPHSSLAVNTSFQKPGSIKGHGTISRSSGLHIRCVREF